MVSHIAPIIVGPVFEMVLGEPSSHPALEPYHIEFIGGEFFNQAGNRRMFQSRATTLNDRFPFVHEIDFGVGMDMFHAVETSMLAAAPTQV